MPTLLEKPTNWENQWHNAALSLSRIDQLTELKLETGGGDGTGEGTPPTQIPGSALSSVVNYGHQQPGPPLSFEQELSSIDVSVCSTDQTFGKTYNY